MVGRDMGNLISFLISTKISTYESEWRFLEMNFFSLWDFHLLNNFKPIISTKIYKEKYNIMFI